MPNREEVINTLVDVGVTREEAEKLFDRFNNTSQMRQVYIFDDKIVDRGAMFSKTPRPFKVHYHKASGICNELCQVIEEGE